MKYIFFITPLAYFAAWLAVGWALGLLEAPL